MFRDHYSYVLDLSHNPMTNTDKLNEIKINIIESTKKLK